MNPTVYIKMQHDLMKLSSVKKIIKISHTKPQHRLLLEKYTSKLP